MVNHLMKYAYLYAIGAIILVIFIIVQRTSKYEMHLFWNMFRLKKEGFQAVSGGQEMSEAMIRDACENMKLVISNYDKLKIQHKDTPIENLDEMLRVLKEYFVSYDCQ